MLNGGAHGVNGGSNVTPSPAEEESFYIKLLGLADTVVSGRHAQFKLPPAAIQQLKASLALLNAPVAGAQQVAESSLANGVAYMANTSTNAQHYPTPTTSTFPGLPGLQTQQPHTVNGAPPSLVKATSGGLNPIFLEKSEVLVKAENRHKRQHIERDLQAQAAQAQGKRPGRDDQSAEAPSLDMNAIMLASAARELHVSGLKQSGRVDSEARSFDTNDYYSSQVQSDWSSPDSASKGSDRAAGALPADFESLGGPSAQSSFAKTSVMGKQPAVACDDHTPKDHASVYSAPLRFAYEVVDDDEDDEYTPPDVSALAGYDDDAGLEEGQIGSEDDDDYEPGEVTIDSNVPTPPQPARQLQQYSPKVIRNHLTHIAAPQPNRVSPLAVAKGPNLAGELELVNGCPEVVSTKYSARNNANASRYSSASPQIGTGGVHNKKRRNKKRKRDTELNTANGRAKKKRERQAAPPSPVYSGPRVKDEPMSPPPFADVPETRTFARYVDRPAHYRPAEIDLMSPRHIPLPPSPYVPEPRASGLRHEYAQPASPSAARMGSPLSSRPVQRDTQDLRRVASMHFAQRPASPTQRTYSPAPQRTASMAYGDSRLSQAPTDVRYQEPIRVQEYHDPYGRRPQSPVQMPPPTAPRKIVIDQYGNQYYAAEPEPAPAPPPPYRASVAPIDRRPPPPEIAYERAPSRAAAAYVPPSYERIDARMAPPPSKRRAVEEPLIQYVDANGYPVPAPEFSRPEIRYVEAPASPVYQPPQPRYEMPPPPPRSAREPTSPVYAEPTSPAYAPSRSYSVRPDVPHVPQYTRQASVVPQQYARQASVAPQHYARPEVGHAPPARAMSVVPGYEQPRAPLYASAPPPQQQVRYVDQYGREVVYQSDPRPAPPPTEYRYQ